MNIGHIGKHAWSSRPFPVLSLPRVCCHCCGARPGPPASRLVCSRQSVCHRNSSVLDSGNCLSSELVIFLSQPENFSGEKKKKKEKREKEKKNVPCKGNIYIFFHLAIRVAFSKASSAPAFCSKAFDGSLVPVRCYLSCSVRPSMFPTWTPAYVCSQSLPTTSHPHTHP